MKYNSFQTNFLQICCMPFHLLLDILHMILIALELDIHLLILYLDYFLWILIKIHIIIKIITCWYFFSKMNKQLK